MKISKQQHRYLKRLLILNPKMTVGQAIHRLDIQAYHKGMK